MAAPELVIAESPYKKYPGNVIALPAVDHMAAPRATLTVEADPRASNATGMVVRDTQKIANTNTTSIAAAVDTLTIDTTTLPLIANNDGLMRYLVMFSFLIEGDWDVTNYQSRLSTPNWSLDRCARLALFENSFFGETTPTQTLYYPRKLDQYSLVQSNGLMRLGFTPAIHIRACGRTGSTVEWLLDQIILIPYNNTTGNPWHFNDFELVAGQLPNFSDTESTNDWIDGADGGDDLGKFTLQPFCNATDSLMTFTDGGGGDYQRKADAESSEYSFHVVPNDSYFLADSQKLFPNNETRAHCYGFHGSYYIPAQDWINDTFSRSSGGDENFAGTNNHFASQSNWTDTPEGFTWLTRSGFEQLGPFDDPNFAPGTYRSGKALVLNGSKAIMHIRRFADDDFTFRNGSLICAFAQPTLVSSTLRGGQIHADNLSISGKFAVTDVNEFVISLNDTLFAGNVAIQLFNPLGTLRPMYTINFDVVNREWYVRLNDWPTGADVVSPTSLPWWTGTQEVGFRIEVSRYRMRIKIWEVSGGEPSTWNYDDFRPIYTNLGVSVPYPYGDDLQIAWREWDVMSVALCGATGVHEGQDPEVLRIEWDDIVISNRLEDDDDPISPTHFAMYQPDSGTKISEIEVPVGAQYMVYWGSRDWTTFVTGDGPYIDLAMKAWNETTAPKLQRAETIALYLATKRGGGPVDLSKLRFRAFQFGDLEQ